jgi:GNAT superfamily N-acetyltransferase
MRDFLRELLRAGLREVNPRESSITPSKTSSEVIVLASPFEWRVFMEWKQKDYLISTNSDLLQIEQIHAYLSTQAYWCLGIPKEILKKAIEGSLCFGVYRNTECHHLQIGFARIVTDRATFAWLCDVYIENEHRGRGLSKWLMECIASHPDLKNLRRFCLATKDAHGLYEKFGFQVTQTPGNWMEIKDNDLYKKMAANIPAIEAHENARELLIDLRNAGEELRAKSEGSS